jgi:hypothetical protein
MSEYNADIDANECCGESINGDDNDDIFDNLNNIYDSEVLNINLNIKSNCFFLLFKGRPTFYNCWYMCSMEKN